MQYLEFRNKKIAYTDDGAGKCIVLLHGYAESSLVWKKFREHLVRDFRVITIDLPGFGESECVARIHTMELMAEVVREILKTCNVKHCMMTGHSMGGFVTLAFARKYPRILRGLCLFNSHPFEDTEEGKKNRERAIYLMRENRQNYIFQFIPSLFAPKSQEKYGKEIREMVTEASKISTDSLIASSEGMKLRPDSAELLKSLEIPVLFIVGMSDLRAPLDRIGEMILLPHHSESLILKDIGHVGYIEAFDKTLRMVRDFGNKVLAENPE